jgi:hypothetical protein
MYCSFGGSSLSEGGVNGGTASLDEVVKIAMNRWRKIDQGFNMVEHYTHARGLMPVTWRYLYVQQDG